MGRMPGFVRVERQFGVVPHQMVGFVFDSEAAAEMAYVQSAKSTRVMWSDGAYRPCQVPTALPVCIRAEDTGPAQVVVDGAPDVLDSCFLMSIAPVNRVAWQVLTGCVGIDEASTSMWDILVFGCAEDAEASREVLVSAGFRCTDWRLGGEKCRSPRSVPYWKSTAVLPWASTASMDKSGLFWTVLATDFALPEWVDAATRMPNFVRLVRGGERGHALCANMLGFVFDTRTAAEDAYMYFAPANGMGRFARPVRPCCTRR
jgi:hypothetical protein